MSDDFILKVSKGKFRKLRELNRRRNWFLKKIKLQSRIIFVKLIWDKNKKNDFDIKKVKNILFIRNEGTIGDQVVYYPLIRKLHEAGFIVDILLTKSSSCFMQHNPYIREIYESEDSSAEEYLKKIKHKVSESVIKKLNNNKYDLVIDPSLDIPVHRFSLLNDINAHNVIGFNKWSIMKHYSVSIDFKDSDKHITESIKLLSTYLDIDCHNIKPYDIYIPDNILKEVRLFLEETISSQLIVINIFAGSKERCLCINQLSTLINKLNELYAGINMVILDHRNEIKISLPDNVKINPFKTIHHMMALIHESDLVISPDTSVVHISAAWEKNLIAIYKDVDANTKLWAPGYEAASQIVVHTRSLCNEDYIPELILAEIKNRHIFKTKNN